MPFLHSSTAVLSVWTGPAWGGGISGTACNILRTGTVSSEGVGGDIHPLLHGLIVGGGGLHVVDIIKKCNQETRLVWWYFCAGCCLVRGGGYVVFQGHEVFFAYQGDEVQGCIPISFQCSHNFAVGVQFDDVCNDVGPDAFRCPRVIAMVSLLIGRDVVSDIYKLGVISGEIFVSGGDRGCSTDRKLIGLRIWSVV
jgi:hypothetical protein